MGLPQHEGWITWAGGKSAPVGDDVIVEVKYRGERRHVATMPAGNFSWTHWGDGTDIVAYRFVAQKLSLESGRIYLDEDGYLHGPVVATEGIFCAGGMGSWLPDGEPADSDATRLIGEWTPPVPQHAAEENERLRHECDRLTGKVDLLTQERDSANDRAMAIFRRKNELLGQIEGLKHDVDIQRDAAADAADDLRKVESRFLLALHAACVEAGVNVLSDDATDEEAVYGHLVNGIRALRRNLSLHEEIAAEIKAESPGRGYTAVHIPSHRLEEFSGACSDLGCWMKGYVAGLPRDEFGNVTGERDPMGRYVITEINIALKSALNRADAEKKS